MHKNNTHVQLTDSKLYHNHYRKSPTTIDVTYTDIKHLKFIVDCSELVCDLPISTGILCGYRQSR